MIKSLTNAKVAIFYDWLNHSYGGAEKVLVDILTLFPQADLYTLVHDPLKTSWLPSSVRIFTSPLNYFPFAKLNPLIYTPFYTFFLRSFNLSSYHLVISTTTTIGHQLPFSPSQLSVCYFHNINRYLYRTPPPYQILKPLLKIYQPFDRRLALGPKVLLCNSKTVQARIQQTYHRQAKVIYPGIDVNQFTPTPHPTLKYFLIVSRLVRHKNIDLAIRACQSLNLPLKIVGDGRQLSQLQKLSTQNTQFLGQVDHQQLLSLYQNCIALIHPQVEDFGLTAIEAQACGRPVIALAQGGATETVINHQTGLFFYQPTDLLTTLKQFSISQFNPQKCRQHALNFSRQRFMLNFKQTIFDSWQKHTSL